MRLIFLALLGLVGVGPAWAETTHCTPVTSLPATLSAQGVYCLRQDLSTNISSGAAITIANGNVVLDCNGYKLGGLAAGTGSQATGIQASNRSNITVRRCNVRGFQAGIALTSAGGTVPTGLLVEGNRVHAASRLGIAVSGNGSTVRGNTLSMIGGESTGGVLAIASRYRVDVIDNTVDTVLGPSAIGVRALDSDGGVIERNRLRHLSGGQSVGIQVGVSAAHLLVRGNVVAAAPGRIGVECINPLNVARGNVGFGFTQLQAGCVDGGGNLAGQSPP